VYDAVIYPARGLQRQQRLSSAIVELTVRPAVAPPTSHPSAVWLPAVDLRIEEAWSDDGTAFEQGVPKTRALTVVARGVLETQLPELALAATPGLRQYADQPELSRELTAAGIEARRTERYAVIAQQPGRVELPPLELPWWNVATESWEIARVDAASIEVQPGADSGPVPTSATTAPPAAATDASFWPWLSGALGAGWLATVVAWWFGGRLKRERGAGTPSTRPPSAKGLFRQLAAACRVNDAHRTQELLLSWARLQFADDPPASLGALAARLSGPLAAEIAGLEAALYGPKPAEWRGGPLLTELKAARSVARTGQGDDSDPLVPLYR
jgi:hypothetical protein